MSQQIRCRLQDAWGKPIKDSKLNFAPINKLLWKVDRKREKYKWLLTIDDYGVTVFNPLQLPYVLEELAALQIELQKTNILPERQTSAMLNLIDSFIAFIQSEVTHPTDLHIGFMGD